MIEMLVSSAEKSISKNHITYSFYKNKIISELDKNYYKLYIDQKDKMLILNKKLVFFCITWLIVYSISYERKYHPTQMNVYR